MTTIPDTERWMSCLDPDVYVIDSYIVASHDASAYAYPGGDNGLHDKLGSITQSSMYYQQAKDGARWFDMRVDTGLIMKHGITHFQSLKEVLLQLKEFATRHPTEYLFLDFDLASSNLAGDVIKTLIDVLGDGKEDVFVTKHVTLRPDQDNQYNTQLKWKDLFDDPKRQYICMWTWDGLKIHDPLRKGWMPPAWGIRDNNDSCNDKDAAGIVACLDQKLAGWSKERLWITQLIKTPAVSPWPNQHPSDLDSQCAPTFNEWLKKKKNGDKLGIVKRDFISEGWGQEGIYQIIRLNKWANGKSPEIPVGGPVKYYDIIQLQTIEGKYLTVKYTTVGISYLTLQDSPSEYSQFRLWHYKGSNAIGWGWPYSGNPDADSEGANGNFRIALYRPGQDFTVISNNSDIGDGHMFWGISWGDADNKESWIAYDPENLRNSYQIRYGGVLIARTIDHLYWQVDAATPDFPRIKAGTYDEGAATRFVVVKGSA